MKNILAIAVIVLLSSCKTKAVVASATNVPINNTISAEKIIENHYANNKIDFSTLLIKANAKYDDAKLSQSVAAEIKIQKDQKIVVSIRVLGITMAKALITPTSVQYYEKINGTYFEGDYQFLSRWLGADLDYNKVQNMLLGEAIVDLNKEKFIVSIIDNLYKLDDKTGSNNVQSFSFNNDDFSLKQQEMNQMEQKRDLQINYPEYKKYDQMKLPLQLTIFATQEKGKTAIDIEYKSVSFNEELSFPYNVPEGYEKIEIDKK